MVANAKQTGGVDMNQLTHYIMEMQKESVTRSTSNMLQARGRHPIAVVASEMVLTARSADKNRGTNRGEALAIWYQGCIQLRRRDGIRKSEYCMSYQSLCFADSV